MKVWRPEMKDCHFLANVDTLFLRLHLRDFTTITSTTTITTITTITSITTITTINISIILIFNNPAFTNCKERLHTYQWTVSNLSNADGYLSIAICTIQSDNPNPNPNPNPIQYNQQIQFNSIQFNPIR